MGKAALWHRWAETNHRVLPIPTIVFEGAGWSCLLPTQTSVSTKIFQEETTALAETDAFLLESLPVSMSRLSLFRVWVHRLPGKGLLAYL